MYLSHCLRYLSSGGLSTELRLPPPAELDLAFDPSEPAWRRQVRDVTRLSLPTLLRYEDRNSMANSLETRLPFLDYRFVELALALPSVTKVKHGFGKRVLREAMRQRVPRLIRTARYKRGFDTPQSEWVTDGLGTAIRTALHRREATMVDWLPAGGDIDRLFSDARLGTSPSSIGEATTLLWLAQRA
jgi:asparagine synthase (glutamine-hydrolysing)